MGADGVLRDRPVPVGRTCREVPRRAEPRRHDKGRLEELCKEKRKNPTCSSGEAPVSPSPSRGPGRGSMEPQVSCGSTFERYASSGLDGFFGRTSRERCRARMGRISDACSKPWMASGMVWHGGFLTRSSSEWPSNAAVSFLSDILESAPPSRYCLSPTACDGILRRAARRGKSLPKQLEEALVAQASQSRVP